MFSDFLLFNQYLVKTQTYLKHLQTNLQNYKQYPCRKPISITQGQTGVHCLQVKIQRKLEVLSNNLKTSRDIKYVTGDKVFQKRASDKRWKNPCCVLGQDGQQMLVTHGIDYVRVHPCRLSLERTIHTEINTETKEQNFNQEQQNLVHTSNMANTKTKQNMNKTV